MAELVSDHEFQLVLVEEMEDGAIECHVVDAAQAREQSHAQGPGIDLLVGHEGNPTAVFPQPHPSADVFDRHAERRPGMDTEGGVIGDIPHVGATSGPVDEKELKQPDRSGHEQGYRLPGRDRPQPP